MAGARVAAPKSKLLHRFRSGEPIRTLGGEHKWEKESWNFLLGRLEIVSALVKIVVRNGDKWVKVGVARSFERPAPLSGESGEQRCY